MFCGVCGGINETPNFWDFYMGGSVSIHMATQLHLKDDFCVLYKEVMYNLS